MVESRYEFIREYSTDQLSIEVNAAQELAELRNQEEYKQRHLKAMLAMCTPEAIAARQAEYHATFEAATKAGLTLKKLIRAELGLPEDDPPLPDPLPSHMKGQAESTIRAMLRQESWIWDKDFNIWKQK